MLGPGILVRTISKPKDPDKKFGNRWQYNPRSDRHSKAACWSILFDLLCHSARLRDQAAQGKIVFGINHEMRDFQTGRKKDLDLVVCTPGTRPEGWEPKAGTFRKLAKRYSMDLTDEDVGQLAALPEVREDVVGEVHIALEAKACMTEHLKALPRLYDELSSSHLTIHGNSPYAIAAGFVMVNVSDRFISPDRNKWALADHVADVSSHDQPRVTKRVVEKVTEIQRRSSTAEVGFDAIGLVLVACVNDGSAVKIVADSPAPQPGHLLHYDAMIRRIAKLYESRFPHE
jgi:hypothetical protein